MTVDVASEDAASLPYHEPGIQQILILVSLLLLLNAINAALDTALYCGLLGQVLIGIAWGTPGAKWLSTEIEEVIVQLGYLGLIPLVYEGGLHTSFQSLKSNLLLSTGVALTGICIPIGLSYTLQSLLDATLLQAFAAGAALCSTSLGTTFTVLGSSGLSSSCLGVVITSAAMMDDMVGLVMVQVISSLGGENFNAITIVDPVLVSVAFAVVVPFACLFVLRPCTLRLNKYRESHPSPPRNELLCKTQTAFTFHTALLIALIAGATNSWWDSAVSHVGTNTGTELEPTKEKAKAVNDPSHRAPGAVAGPSKRKDAPSPITPDNSNQASQYTQAAGLPHETNKMCDTAVFEHYYYDVVYKMLQPLFFASVGFSIPLTRMFRGGFI